MKFLSRLLCRLGYHGPHALGYEPQLRSSRNAPLERTCEVCGAQWHATPAIINGMRSATWDRVPGTGK